MRALFPTLLAMMALHPVFAGSAVSRVDWTDLMPPGETAPLPLFGHPGTFMDLPPAEQPGDFKANGKVVGQEIELSGFAVPLELHDGKVSRFLLVPYYGACIHLPPPPPNQIVDVTLATPIKLGAASDPMTVQGLLRAEAVETDLAGAAYRIHGASLSKAQKRRR